MKARAHMNVSPLTSICYHEICRRLTRPVLRVVFPSLWLCSWILWDKSNHRLRASQSGTSNLLLRLRKLRSNKARRPSQLFFFAIYTNSSFFSNSAMRIFLVDKYLAFPEPRSAWSTSTTSFYVIEHHKSWLDSLKSTFLQRIVSKIALNKLLLLRSSTDPWPS